MCWQKPTVKLWRNWKSTSRHVLWRNWKKLKLWTVFFCITSNFWKSTSQNLAWSNWPWREAISGERNWNTDCVFSVSVYSETWQFWSKLFVMLVIWKIHSHKYSDHMPTYTVTSISIHKIQNITRIQLTQTRIQFTNSSVHQKLHPHITRITSTHNQNSVHQNYIHT